jgi:hypothetical protein
MDINDEFWYKWFHADESEQLKMVHALTGFKEDSINMGLLNSYLNDLASYLEGYWSDFYSDVNKD